MIEAIEVRNFKSLVHFTLTGLGPFVCLIGLNGAGKTSLLQALEFLGTCFSDAAGFRDWELSEILSQQTKQRTCEFEVRMRLGEMGVLTWCGVFNVDKRRFMEESVTENVTGKVLCRLKDRIFSISDTHVSLDVGEFKYYGSIFSLYRFDKHPALAALGKAFRSLRSLGLLSPESMRGATRWVREMGLGGEGFAGFLSSLPKDDLEALQERLKRFYPDFVRMDFKRKRAGWIRLCMEERSNGDATSFGRTELRHVNDGFLRLTALLAQRFSEDRILLFDEVENGFNQELVGQGIANILSIELSSGRGGRTERFPALSRQSAADARMPLFHASRGPSAFGGHGARTGDVGDQSRGALSSGRNGERACVGPS